MSKNITMFLNANVVDFEFFEEKSVVSGAIIKNLQGKTWRMEASNFVVSCGAVENAKILLNVSNSGSSNALNKLTSIGKNFAEHPNATIGYLEGENAKKIYEIHKTKHINGSKEIKPGLGISAEIQEEKGILNGIISIWPIPLENSTLSRAKILLELFRKKKFGLKFLVNTFWVLPSIVSLLPHVMHRLRGGVVNIPQRDDRFEVRLMTETLPNPCSRVELTDQQDAIGLNMATLDWRLTKQDRTSFSTIAGLAKKHLETTQGVELVLDRWIEDASIDWTKFINRDGHYGHHMGTTRMGLNPTDSVVDEHCKVHGLKNLYVAGSSVFPTFGFANPTLTIVALAIKLADHLKQQLKA
jgi:choline dehydrogenase-like flavoprotein